MKSRVIGYSVAVVASLLVCVIITLVGMAKRDSHSASTIGTSTVAGGSVGAGTVGSPIASTLPPAVVPDNATPDSQYSGSTPSGGTSAVYDMPSNVSASQVQAWYAQQMPAGQDFQGLRWLEDVTSGVASHDWYWCAPTPGYTLDVSVVQNSDSVPFHTTIWVADQRDTQGDC